MLLFRVWTYINMEITCKNSGSNLKHWARFWDLKIFRKWDFARLYSQKTTKHTQFLRYRAHLLAMAFMGSFFGHSFHGTPGGDPTLFMNFSLIVGNLSPASLASTGKRIFFHKARILLCCQPWSSCTKNLENIKWQFLNSPVLFPSPYSIKINKIRTMFWFITLVS